MDKQLERNLLGEIIEKIEKEDEANRIFEQNIDEEYETNYLVIDQYYDKNMLDELNDEYFIPWAKADVFPNSKELLKKLTSKPTKRILIDTFVLFMTDERTSLKAYEKMEPVVKAAFDECVWNGVADIEKLYKIFNVKIKNIEKSGTGRVLDVKFRFFKTDYNFRGQQKGVIHIDEWIALKLKKSFPKPDEAKLQNVDKIKTMYTANYENEILENIHVLLEMKRNGDIEFGSTKNLTKALVNNFSKSVKVDELYKVHLNEEAKHLKRDTLLKYLCYSDTSMVTERDFPEEQLKEFMDNFFNASLFKTKDYYGYSAFSISLVKTLFKKIKIKLNYTERIDSYLADLKALLTEMCSNEWVEIINIINSNIICGRNPFPFYRKDAESLLMYNEMYSYRNVQHIDAQVFEKLLTPFTKGMMAVMAAFGIVEIAYDNFVDNNHVTYFDGIKYVKVTELGKYILGKNDGYKSDIVKNSNMEIVLSESELLIKTIGEDKIKSMMLSKIGEKSEENIYKVTFESVFKGCENEKEVEAKINKFMLIVGDVPDTWKLFFAKIKRGFTPLVKVDRVILLKIKDDKELTNIIAKDNDLKKLILKTENFHIAVDERNLTKVTKILRGYGYF